MQLAELIRELVEPKMVGGVKMCSVLDQLHALGRPRNLIIEIEQTAAKWYPELASTADRLRIVANNPKDSEAMARTVKSWIRRADRVLNPKPRRLIPGQCPECGASEVVRDHRGEEVRQPTLLVGVDGCECRSCRAVWEPDQLLDLAKYLGFPTPEGVCA
ncbi:hypothetical protein PXH78_09320 [Mycolicibacterium smegmatis]|uniref:DUF7340 domain-containing protein n=1 Tax=Mycolicibacterium smegmatis TaxID=1772 RepID=UPI00071AF62E|nr:hypothetical protein [Mycolicibacterium smegmatis]MDF1899067.1 hypothetical protein [Mycolicibacterium smegmatis]MDF1904891.1 hypothetical protein [Mycolicibacterium smegmatis]MDF1918760.1 hypothetical protein [Mycolicibacterium smegmatis]MDF1924055.1 hypothetical protein [Mycolicibacterium smegmatis]UAK53341.1 hypothetical protein K8P01_22375 [Mycolicibacterium smegmatis]